MPFGEASKRNLKYVCKVKHVLQKINTFISAFYTGKTAALRNLLYKSTLKT